MLSGLHLLAEVTASPGLTGPAMDIIHVSGVRDALRLAVHVLKDLVKMDHLDVVVPPVASNHSDVRREGDRPVVEAVHDDDVYWRVRHYGIRL